jgi:probable HAF family extracellular repeat protein
VRHYLAILILPSLLAAQGTFTRLGRPGTNVSGISADGTIVVGSRSNAGPAFRWTAAEGVANIGGVGFRAKISRDGKTIVSDAQDSQGVGSAAIWQGGTNWRVLGGIPGGQPSGSLAGPTLSTAWDISADGSIIIGLAWVSAGRAHAFRWDAQHGMVDLGSLQGRDSRASTVSADGNVIAGFDSDPSSTHGQWRGAIWWQGLERLMNPFGWIGQVEAANNQGSVLVGQGHPSHTGHAFRYTAWDGDIIDLGALPRGLTPGQMDQEDISIAYAVSDDGSVVIGNSGYRPPVDAFVWTPTTKMIKLSTYLTGHGVTGFERWRLVQGAAVTPDGKTIAGVGINPEGFYEGFVATVR